LVQGRKEKGFMSGPTLATIARQLADGTTTSRQLVEQCLERIADPDGEGARAFLSVDPVRVRAAADGIDRLRAAGAAPGPYAGIPVSVKDLFDVAGEATRAGSMALDGAAAAAHDAPSVARLRRAGLVLIGRTNMSEFAFSGVGLNPHFGTPLNPWQRSARRIPGGSSSGAAVSVADGMAHAALGTDTGGSCRIPAAFTGLVGYKPTARRVPLKGTIPLAPSLDSVGPIARSVDCCAALDALLSNGSPAALGRARLAGLRLAMPATLVLDGMDDVVARRFDAALARLSAAGAVIVRQDMPELADIAVINRNGGFTAAESYAWHRLLLEAKGAQYDPRVLARIRRGAVLGAADYRELVAARCRLIEAMTRRAAPFDALILPTVPIVPPRLAELESDAAFTGFNLLILRNPSVVNMIDGCAISLPIGEPDGAPVGLMLAAMGGRDRALLRIAAAVEHALAR
jgi:aspartyl-tRNA(Asn)/glutamyl-tRNA(Gln) amidotransferase subunit A